MKPHLLYRDQDFDLDAPSRNGDEVAQDLDLATIWAVMAGGDQTIAAACQTTLLDGLRTSDAVAYRQAALADCLDHPEIVTRLYRITRDAREGEKRIYGSVFGYRTPSGVLAHSIEVLRFLAERLRGLRALIDSAGTAFRSEAFRSLAGLLAEELTDDYFGVVEQHLKELELNSGVTMTASLGDSNRGTNYVLHRSAEIRQGWVRRVTGMPPPGFTLTIAERDMAGTQALADLRDRGVALVARALGRSAQRVVDFFSLLEHELAFYVGCINLHEALQAMGAPMCIPAVCRDHRHRSATGLYDVALALRTGKRVVGNDLPANGKDLVFITGANQGGKSTFLRAIGNSQLMAEAGMFVPAEAWTGPLSAGVFTHFRRDEDNSMTSGKLNEELSRMSATVDQLRPGSLMLFNESFAATNEHEGTLIATGILSGLLQAGVEVAFVTHFYELPIEFASGPPDTALFLRAERLEDGTRTYKLREGPPLQTSYGQDLYRQIFGSET